MKFSSQEMKRRLETARVKMQEKGIDCLMVTGIENFSYFTGVPVELYQHRRPWCALIPIEGEPVVITTRGIDRTVKSWCFFKVRESYVLPVSENLPRKVAEIIKSFGAKRVACELGLQQRLGIPLKDFEAIKTRLPDVNFVDGADIIWSLRKFKSEEEIERIRRACDITGQTRQKVFQQIDRGMTEEDVAHLWRKLMYEAGADRPSFIFINSGEYLGTLPKPGRKLKKGDALYLDGGVYVEGYTCDFSRIATIGKSSARQRRLHKDLLKITEKTLERVRPGVRVSELCSVCQGEMKRLGYPSERPMGCGHGMGMLVNEPPLIAPWDDTVLSEGTLIGIEPSLLGIEPSIPVAEGIIVWEEILHVKEDGYDLLTTEPSDLIEIPW